MQRKSATQQTADGRKGQQTFAFTYSAGGEGSGGDLIASRTSRRSSLTGGGGGSGESRQTSFSTNQVVVKDALLVYLRTFRCFVVTYV